MSLATADNAWVNSQEGRDPAVLARAVEILTRTRYGSLATCCPGAVPWVSPVFFTYDAHWHLYWSSAIAARHSQNLYHNQGQVAIAIYGTEADYLKGQGLYLSGTAGELPPEAVAAALASLLKRAGGS
ncbi:MAG: pyridoxamine 5'-phosphate oxidase family protein, partial [Cyanobacteria bacterium]|nr:pyridoxamine 5'-phosphate oxidase family protein [Cyanobacteriota bacterium]